MGIFITKEYIMKKIIRLTESDLARIVKRVIKENKRSERVFDEILYIIDTSNSTEEFEKRIKEIEPELEDLPKEKYNQYMSFINSLKDNWSFENKEER